MTNARDKANIPVLNFQSKGIDDNATSTAVTITSAENIGIGTTSPGNKLHIHTSSSGEGILVKSTGNTYNEIIADANRTGSSTTLGRFRGNWNTNPVAFISLSTGDDTTNKDDGRIMFSTSSSGSSPTERMRIQPNGSIGIGTTLPATPLHILTTDGGNVDESLTITNASTTSGTGSRIRFVSSTDISSTPNSVSISSYRNAGSNHDLLFESSNAEKMRVTSSGLIGIGTSSPSSYYANHLVVDIGSTAQSGITIVADSSNQAMLAFADGTSGDTRYRGYLDYNHSNDSLAFATAGSEVMRITSTGLGIGTSSPESFHSSGNDLVVGNTTGGNGLTIVASTNDAGSINFADGSSSNTSYRGKITYEHSNDSLAFHTGATEKFRVGSNGNFSIGTTADDEKLVVNGNVKATAFQGDGSALTGISSGAGSVVAYIMFSGSNNSVQSTANVSSVNDNGTGEYIINFTTDLANANYTMAGAGRDPNTNGSIIGDVSYGRSDSIKEDGRCEIATYGDSANLSDFPEVNATFFQ